MHQRVNITLPEETLRLIDRAVKKRNRSRFIDRAVRHYVQAMGRKQLRQQLEEETTKWAEHDLRLAAEWFLLDEEAWQRIEK